MASVPDWLVGVGSILGGAAAVWTGIQQRQLNKHDKRLKDLEDNDG